MAIVGALISLLLLVLMPAVLLKLSTLLTRVMLLWRHCFGYAGIVTAISVVFAVTTATFQYSPHAAVSLLTGGVLHLGIGTWYVGKFGRSKNGAAATGFRSLLTMLVFVVLLGLLVGAFALLASLLATAAQQRGSG